MSGHDLQLVHGLLFEADIPLPDTKIAGLFMVFKYSPSLQELQKCAPGIVLLFRSWSAYVPLAQNLHAVASVTNWKLLPRVPLGIAHDKHTVAPVVPEYLPWGQMLHVVLPTAELYLPAPHLAHSPPFGPENPALHRQLARAGLALGACEFDGQSWQVALPVPEN